MTVHMHIYITPPPASSSALTCAPQSHQTTDTVRSALRCPSCSRGKRRSSSIAHPPHIRDTPCSIGSPARCLSVACAPPCCKSAARARPRYPASYQPVVMRSGHPTSSPPPPSSPDASQSPSPRLLPLLLVVTLAADASPSQPSSSSAAATPDRPHPKDDPRHTAAQSPAARAPSALSTPL